MIHFSSISCQSTLKNINTVCIFVDSRRNLGNMILYLRQVRWFRGQSLSIPVIQKTEDNLFFCPNTFFQYFIQLIFGICAYAGIGVIFQINLQKHQRIWIGSATFSAPGSRFLRLLIIWKNVSAQLIETTIWVVQFKGGFFCHCRSVFYI